MIATSFTYDKPETIEAALTLFETLNKENKEPIYFNGGTEIITFLRIHTLYTHTKAVIDIKNIDACHFIGYKNNKFIIGASVPLAMIEELIDFPLLSKVCNRIADHTSREKITLGGNICSNLKYKEAILPLLLTDSQLMIASPSGVYTVPIQQIYNTHTGKIDLEDGAFIVQIWIDEKYLRLPFVSKKVTQSSRIGYPLVTATAINVQDHFRFAFSGLCESPFHSKEIDLILNDNNMTIEERITLALQQLPSPVIADMNASSAFRKFILSQLLKEIFSEFGKG